MAARPIDAGVDRTPVTRRTRDGSATLDFIDFARPADPIALPAPSS